MDDWFLLIPALWADSPLKPHQGITFLLPLSFLPFPWNRLPENKNQRPRSPFKTLLWKRRTWTNYIKIVFLQSKSGLLLSKSIKPAGQVSLIICTLTYGHLRNLSLSLQGVKNLKNRQDSEVSLNLELPKGWEHWGSFGLSVRISCQNEASLLN